MTSDYPIAESNPESNPHTSNGHVRPVDEHAWDEHTWDDANSGPDSRIAPGSKPEGSKPESPKPAGPKKKPYTRRDKTAQTPLPPPPASGVDGMAAPNEFTFGWNDLEMGNPVDGVAGDPSSSHTQPVVSPPGRTVARKGADLHRAAKVQGRRRNAEQMKQATEAAASARSAQAPSEHLSSPPDPAAPLCARAEQLAHQAAQSTNPVVAVGLITATAPLVLQEDELLPSLLSATAWIAWRLHRRPAQRGRLTLLPVALRRVATALHAGARKGHTQPVRQLAQMLLQEIEAQLPRPVSLPLSLKESSTRRGKFSTTPRNALARLDRILEEWWQDEPHA